MDSLFDANRRQGGQPLATVLGIVGQPDSVLGTREVGPVHGWMGLGQGEARPHNTCSPPPLSPSSYNTYAPISPSTHFPTRSTPCSFPFSCPSLHLPLSLICHHCCPRLPLHGWRVGGGGGGWWGWWLVFVNTSTTRIMPFVRFVKQMQRQLVQRF